LITSAPGHSWRDRCNDKHLLMPCLVCMLLFLGLNTAHSAEVAYRLWVQQLQSVRDAYRVQVSPMDSATTVPLNIHAAVPSVAAACVFRTCEFTCEVNSQQAAVRSQGERIRAPAEIQARDRFNLSVLAAVHCMPRQQSSTRFCCRCRPFSRRLQQRLRPSFQRSTGSSCSSTRDLW
jgi:hypothetical protein